MDVGSPTDDDLKRILNLVPPIAWDVTVPIMLYDDGELRQHGTGTLLRVAHEYFLVTASHVPRQARKAGAELFLTASSAGESLVEAHGTWHGTSPPDGGDHDAFDVAVQQLTAETVNKLGGRAFVSLNDVWKKLPLEEDIYVACGYPCEMSTPGSPATGKVTLGPLKLVTSLYDGPTTMMDGKSPKFENYDPRYHFLLNANKRNIRTMEGIGATFPDDLSGISGCSVWKMNVKSYPRENWTSEKARIVGVQNHVHGSRTIRATYWAAVVTLLHKAVPALRPAIGLWRPN